MSKPQIIRTPSCEDVVDLPRAEYEALLEANEDLEDVLVAERSLAQIVAGKVELIPDSEMDDCLAAPTPLAFWRKKRGLTQAGLAERAGITERELAEIESGKEEGRIGVLRDLATALEVTVDELAG